MCAPTCRGGAYLAASVFIYRSLLLAIASISHGITGRKLTYLDLPLMDEFMLYLIYFIPLFTGGGFALMGIEEDSFSFVFNSTLSLAATIFIRYTAELTYIYAFDWSAFREKTPELFLNFVVDSIFIATLLIYVYQELRDPVKKKRTDTLAPSKGEADGTLPRASAAGTLRSQTSTGGPNNSNIRNEFEAAKRSPAAPRGIGHGAEPGEALHYPITPVDKEILMKPLPPLPAGTVEGAKEFDEISLPPHIPLAAPDYDEDDV